MLHLEGVFQSDLDHTRSVERVVASDRAKVARSNVSNGSSIPWVIERVEELGSQHQPVALERHFEILRNANIDDFLAVPEEGVTPDNAVTKVGQVRRSERRSWQRVSRS